MAELDHARHPASDVDAGLGAVGCGDCGGAARAEWAGEAAECADLCAAASAAGLFREEGEGGVFAGVDPVHDVAKVV